jgi:hypothetical protein
MERDRRRHTGRNHLNSSQQLLAEFDQPMNEGAVLLLRFQRLYLALRAIPNRTFDEAIISEIRK